MKRLPNQCVYCGSNTGQIREVNNQIVEQWYYTADPIMWGPFCSKTHVASWDGNIKEGEAAIIFGSNERLEYMKYLISNKICHQDDHEGVFFISGQGKSAKTHLHCPQCDTVTPSDIEDKECSICHYVIS